MRFFRTPIFNATVSVAMPTLSVAASMPATFCRALFLSGLLAMPTLTCAEEPPPDLEAVPEPPDAPMPIESGETMEPDITIIRKGKKTIQEYRINGELYMIKIIPAVGPPYYLIDSDGDGTMDVRGTDLEKGMNINQWKLLEWN